MITPTLTGYELMLDELDVAGVEAESVRLMLDVRGWRVEMNDVTYAPQSTPELALRHCLNALQIREPYSDFVVRRSCTDKEPYHGLEHTSDIRRAIERETGLRLRIYECRFCESFI